MASLSQNDHNIIAEHPLNSTLDHLRGLLRKTEKSCDAVDDDSDQGLQKAILELLAALLLSDPANYLPSRTGNGYVASDLLRLRARIQKGDFNYQLYRSLSQLVIKKASDVNIWSAVFELIITSSRKTPPTSIPVSFDGTPVTSSSASQQGGEQTRQLVEARVFEEIRECTYRNVGGFFSKYFEEKDWTEQTKEIYRAMQDRHVDGRWTDFPDPPVQNAVLEWLFRFQEEFLADSRGVYYTSESSNNLTGAEARRQLDVFVKPNGKNISKTVHDWKDVEVIGELSESHKEWKVKLLQLGRYMRDVFATQPTRRFVHGFTLLGYTMELWVFDRSGPYSSGVFDIHKEPEQFIRAITGYTMMSDEDLGLDTFTGRNEEYRSITIIEDTAGTERRLWLEPIPIAHQRAIVCRGTSCFRARTPSSEHFQYVAKFSWVSDKRRPEADLLRLARERGVEGVARLFGHHCITSIADIREGLEFGKPYAFRNTTLSPASPFSQSQSLLSQSFGLRFSLGTAGEPPKKRKPVGAGGSSFKRSRSNSQSPDNAKWDKEINSQTTSLYTHDDSSFDNRIFGCLVISPAGRAIRDFRSIPELLEALRDAIKAHRSLYTKGQILHRDISENNIIITDPKEAGGFTGMLIDEDLAKEIGSERSGARHQTGTMEFMAIQVLQGVAHTYRHDLESFFYVLLWICARRVWEKGFQCRSAVRPRESVLTKWYSGSFKDIADAKRGYMHVDGFERVLDEFPPAFDCIKPLCGKLRGILFPYNNGLLIGTPSDPPEELYRHIIDAFDSAISEIAAG